MLPRIASLPIAMMLPRIVSLPIAMVLLLTMAACAGGAVEVNTVPTATSTAGVNPTNRPIVIPTNRPVVIPTGPSSNSTRPGVAGQMDPCNCHGYAGFGGPCYDGFVSPVFSDI